MKNEFNHGFLRFKSNYLEKKISWLWVFIEPAAYVLVYYIAFGVFLGRGGEGFIYDLLIGISSWLVFSRCVISMSGCYESFQSILKVYRIKLPHVRMVVLIEAFLSQIIFLLLVVIFCWSQYNNINIVGVFICLLNILLYSWVVGSLLAIIIGLQKDLRFLISPLISGWMFLSGVFYTTKDIPKDSLELFLINPMAYFIAEMRSSILKNDVDLIGSFNFLAIGILFLLALIFIDRKLEKNIKNRIS